jgi:hypothetical protein
VFGVVETRRRKNARSSRGLDQRPEAESQLRARPCLPRVRVGRWGSA